MENDTNKEQQETMPNEGAKVKMQGHLLIRDAETGEELVNKRNAIHFGNMAFVIANAMSYWKTADNGVYHMAFGNGGSDVLNTGEIKYKATNTGNIKDDSAALYNRTYYKIIGKDDDGEGDEFEKYKEMERTITEENVDVENKIDDPDDLT